MSQVRSFQEYIESNFYTVLEEFAEEYLWNNAGELQVEREKDITLRDIEFIGIEVYRVWTEDSPESLIHFSVIVIAYYKAFDGNRYGEPKDFKEWIQMDCSGDLSKDLKDFCVEDSCEYDSRNKPQKTLSSGLVPFISRRNLGYYSKQLLNTYWPEIYSDYIPVEPVALAERMGLKVFERRLTAGCSIFGEMIFAPCSLDIYDENRKNMHKEFFSAGTILVDPDIAFIRGMGSKNTTIIHECVHWFYHRKTFELQRLSNSTATRIECHTSGNMNSILSNEEKGFIEWQANALPTYIMAPDIVLRTKVEEIFNNYEHENETLDYVDFIEDVIRDVSDFFGISKQAAKIRMVQCGYEIARGAFEYIDGRYVRPYQGKAGCLNDDETYSVSIIDVILAEMQNPELKEEIDNGALVYIDSHLVLNAPKYFTRDFFGNKILSQYALNHADECMVKFKFDFGKFQNLKGFMLECVLCRDKNTGIRTELIYDKESNVNLSTKFEANKRRWKDIEEGLGCIVVGSAGASLEQLMEWSGNLTHEKMAELVGRVPRTISRWINEDSKMDRNEMIAVCVALKLPYEVSKEFLKASGYIIESPTEENLLLSFFLRTAEYDTLSISDCNALLVEKGFSPLIGDKKR